jgi:hypothetical protein
VGETQERQLQEDFGELLKWVERLPPMVDRPYLVFVPCGLLYLNFASVQSAGKSSGRATIQSRREVRRIFTPVNGLAKRYGTTSRGDGSRKFRTNSFQPGGPCISPEPEPCRAGGEMRCQKSNLIFYSLPSSGLPKTSRNMEDTPTSEYSATARYSFYWRLRLFSM